MSTNRIRKSMSDSRNLKRTKTSNFHRISINQQRETETIRTFLLGFLDSKRSQFFNQILLNHHFLWKVIKVITFMVYCQGRESQAIIQGTNRFSAQPGMLIITQEIFSSLHKDKLLYSRLRDFKIINNNHSSSGMVRQTMDIPCFK